MTVRAFSLVVLLLALGVGGYVFSRQAQEIGPTSETFTEAKAQAIADVVVVNFQQAVPALEAHYAAAGTYAGAQLPPSYGVVVARADDVSYCLQGGVTGAVQHLTGPGGSPTPGPC